MENQNIPCKYPPYCPRQAFFFKIKPGLWALNAIKNKLPIEVFSAKTLSSEKQKEFNHTYDQGLLEIGNLKRFQTFVPYQDKNKVFLGKRLGDIASIKEFYKFSYGRLVQRTQTIDVSWFNKRKMPNAFSEVEHSTGIQRSLVKREFNSKILSTAFDLIFKRVNFLEYERLSEWHAKTAQLLTLEKGIF